jgi:hypothetical protein
MNFREQAEIDMSALLGGEFSEAVTIGGKSVNAVVSREAGPDSGNEISSEGSSERAVIFVGQSDYSSPRRGDIIRDQHGVDWRVIRSSPLPGLSRLICVSGENPWG